MVCIPDWVLSSTSWDVRVEDLFCILTQPVLVDVV